MKGQCGHCDHVSVMNREMGSVQENIKTLKWMMGLQMTLIIALMAIVIT